ncbi:hypothetical protein [Fictibacillus terranigra]|uniref:Uncharacterized protein n=1 Tax=Fictibacillus terranigra TaxID=3058424 RepID=A0ABT8E2Z5_9BACL|nr:hypothetical protein [Fictibacillus sp. CENA-BCM004]MDN4072293.1 hypothetical protein [Fictibacillus sp. CENA-BCM004]
MKQTMDDKIKNRNSWFKIILISLFCMVLMFKVATAKFTFHFSDLLSFILAVFAIAIAALFYSKVNEIVHLLGGSAPGLLKQNRKRGHTASIAENAPVKSEEDLVKSLDEHKDQLKRLKKVQNEIIDRLLLNQDLQQEDKRDYIDYLLQKEKEAALIQMEADKVAAQLEDADESANVHISAETVTVNSLNDVIAVLGKDVILGATFDELNQKVKSIQPTISQEVSESLLQEGYVDQHFNITRKGLKEFRSTAKRMKNRG